MIVANDKEISQITAYGKVLSSIRVGAVLIWEAIKSCFGKGYGINDKPWTEVYGGKNNV